MNFLKFLIRITTGLIPIAKWRRHSRRWLYSLLDSIEKYSITLRIKKLFISLIPIAKYRRRLRKKLGKNVAIENSNIWENFKNITILTSKHCLYIAELIQYNLAKIGLSATCSTQYNGKENPETLYFAIAPVLFDELPSNCVIFQLEQLKASSRWFTESYKNKLKKADAILDYSLENISFLKNNDFPLNNLFYLPIGFLKQSISKVNQSYDIVFYGDPTSERRKLFLEKLKQKFNVLVLTDLFGKKLHESLLSAKIVVNIHYYENALLETTRLHESLSLGCFVISEDSTDIDSHPSLKSLIDFTPANDIDAMIERISYWLDHEEKRKETLEKRMKAISELPDMFEYYFMRFLLYKQVISFEQFWNIASLNIHFPDNKVCLYLPEAQERYHSFVNNNPEISNFFPGLRSNPSWVGCGMSYKFLLRKAKEQKFEIFSVCEDDAVLPKSFNESYNFLEEYLLNETKSQWHVFAGFIADLHPQTCIIDTESYNETEFIHLDKMTSMVFNIYHSRFYEALEAWDEAYISMDNTIDRFIENSSNLRIITTYPFIANHRSDHTSLLWESQSGLIYDEMTQCTNTLLEKKMLLFSKNKK